MTKSIFLCASMDFYRELVAIEAKLIKKGWTVFIPQSAKIMKAQNDFEVSHFKGVMSYAERAVLIHRNFDEITSCDAILVINNEKRGVPAYIGPNVLMEIGVAFAHHKSIYIWNHVPDTASYKEELNCFDVTEINQDLSKIILKLTQ